MDGTKRILSIMYLAIYNFCLACWFVHDKGLLQGDTLLSELLMLPAMYAVIYVMFGLQGIHWVFFIVIVILTRRDYIKTRDKRILVVMVLLLALSVALNVYVQNSIPADALWHE